MNLSDPKTVERVFTDQNGAYDYVFNLAGETKYGQSDEVCCHHCMLADATAVVRCTESVCIVCH